MYIGFIIIGFIIIILTFVISLFLIKISHYEVIRDIKRSVGNEQCYTDVTSRCVKKFCINLELNGYYKNFGYAYVLQTFDHDFSYVGWQSVAFVEFKKDKNGNIEYHRLYNKDNNNLINV